MLAGLALTLKPLFSVACCGCMARRKPSPAKRVSGLGQLSEFSLLIAVLAVESGLIEDKLSYLIQLATLIQLCRFFLYHRAEIPDTDCDPG